MRSAVVLFSVWKVIDSANVFGAPRRVGAAGPRSAGYRQSCDTPPTRTGMTRRFEDEIPARGHPPHPAHQVHRREYSHAGGNVHLEPCTYTPSMYTPIDKALDLFGIPFRA